MVQESELVDLILGLVTAVLIVASGFHRRPGRDQHLLLAGYSAILAAYVSTVAEGFVWTEIFNRVEHLCLAAAAVLFALAFRRLGAGRPRGDDL